MDGIQLVAKTEVVETSIGKLTIREICLEDVWTLAEQLGIIIGSLPQDELKNAGGASVLLLVMKNPETLNALKRIIAQLTDSDSATIARLSVKDLLRCSIGFLKLNEIEELRSLFFEAMALLRPTSGTT